jgi:3-hydroxyisobutyrate dehydrogenase-like beta-hydroxyacid dehydrogenase
MRVGFIGLGSQGGPMARQIIRAGFPTALWARRPEALEPFAGPGVSLAESPAALAAASDVVCLCVVDDDDVREVVAALLPGLHEGSTVVVHSTIHPVTCDELAATVAERGASLIDAPVSGGAPAADAGTLVVMVGATEDELERFRPVFATYGDPVLRLGRRGSGLAAKLVNNALMMAQVTLADDALAVAAALGLDRAAFTSVVSSGSGSSYSFGVVTALGSLEAFAEVGAPLLRKDVRILAEVLAGRGTGSGDLVAVADHGLARLEPFQPPTGGA